VQYTRLEEDLHATAGILLINTLRQEYPNLFDNDLYKRIEEECQLALKYEHDLIKWMLQGYEEQSLSEEILYAFVKQRMSEALDKIGFNKLKMTEQEEFDFSKTIWMYEETKGATLTDFFQKRPVEYAKNHRAFDSEELF
jgi:ribonucleoside-diphosphate reductase beta chain